MERPVSVSPELGRLPVDVGCLIGGAWTSSGDTHERHGPYLRRTVTRYRTASIQDVDRALSYAASGSAAVRHMTPSQRGDVLDEAASLAEGLGGELARWLAIELGKPLRDGTGEVARAVDTLRIAAAEARSMGGTVLNAEGWSRGKGVTAMSYRAPVGVVLAITPFNAPINLLAHKIGASFAAGNTTVVKPPPQAPVSSTRFVELLLEAGMPPEAVQVLHGGADVGAALGRLANRRRDQLHRQRSCGRGGS